MKWMRTARQRQKGRFITADVQRPVRSRPRTAIDGCAGNGYITVTSGTHQSTEVTLAEAMQKMREWKEQQK